MALKRGETMTLLCLCKIQYLWAQQPICGEADDDE